MSRAKTTGGLPGLIRVREALNLDNRTLSEFGQVREQFMSRIINGSADCSLAVLRRIMERLEPLGIQVSDLTDPVSDQRFLEMKLSRLESEIDSVRSALQ